jgi:hypothetical protein
MSLHRTRQYGVRSWPMRQMTCQMEVHVGGLLQPIVAAESQSFGLHWKSCITRNVLLGMAASKIV